MPEAFENDLGLGLIFEHGTEPTHHLFDDEVVHNLEFDAVVFADFTVDFAEALKSHARLFIFEQEHEIRPQFAQVLKKRNRWSPSSVEAVKQFATVVIHQLRFTRTPTTAPFLALPIVTSLFIAWLQYIGRDRDEAVEVEWTGLYVIQWIVPGIVSDRLILEPLHFFILAFDGEVIAAPVRHDDLHPSAGIHSGIHTQDTAFQLPARSLHVPSPRRSSP